MSKLKKGIKGQLVLPDNEECTKYIKENCEVFEAVCDRDFRFIEFDIYKATFNNENVIGIDFNILDFTAKEVDSAYSRFKHEIENHFGFKPKQAVKAKYDLVVGVEYSE